MSSIDIALFLPSLGIGGAEKSAVLLANGLTARGLSVSLIVATSNIELAPELDENISFFDCGASRVALSVPKLSRYLSQIKPKALLSFMAHANAAAILAAKVSRTPTKVFVSERTSLSAILGQAGGYGLAINQWLFRQLYRLSNGIIANSHGVKGDLVRIGLLPASKITVIWNGIDYRQIQLSCQDDLPSDDVALFAGPPVVLAVGRLVFEKDYPSLLRIFSRLIKNCDSHLLIIGSGPERETVEGLIVDLQLQGRVTLLGAIANPYPYMRLARVFAHTSLREGFPNALLEAMACGTPVVSYDCRWGPAEILENGKWGSLIDQGDEDSFLAALKELILDGGNSESSSRAMQFDIKETSIKFEKLLFS